MLVGAQMRIAYVAPDEMPEEHRTALQETQTILTDAIQASRHLAVELAPPVLLEAGVFAALEWLAAWVKATYRLEVELDLEPVELHDEHVCLLLFDAVRELVLNVVKHAQVGSVAIKAARLDERLRIVVKDQGVGYDPEEIDMKDDLASGFGLATMRRRIESAGGSFVIESGKGRGTQATIELPLRQSEQCR